MCKRKINKNYNQQTFKTKFEYFKNGIHRNVFLLDQIYLSFLTQCYMSVVLSGCLLPYKNLKPNEEENKEEVRLLLM